MVDNFQETFLAGAATDPKRNDEVKPSRLRSASTLALLTFILAITWQCQTVTEPDQVVPKDGFRVSLKVRSQGNQLLPSLVQWKLISKDSTLSPWQNLDGANGVFTTAIKSALSNDSSVRVVFKTTLSANDAALYSGSLNNGTSRLDTIRLCSEVTLDFNFTKTILPICCPDPIADEQLFLTIEAPIKLSDTAFSPVIPITAGCQTLTIAPLIFAPNDGVFESLVRINNGSWTTISGTQTISAGQTIQFCVATKYVQPEIASRKQYVATWQLLAGAQPCVSGKLNIIREARTLDQCDCSPNNNYTINFPRDTLGRLVRMPLCESKDTSITIADSLRINHPDCSLRYTLVKTTNPQNAVRANGFAGQGVAVATIPSRNFPVKFELSISPNLSIQGNVDASWEYSIEIVSRDGSAKSCGKMTIVFGGTVSPGFCDIRVNYPVKRNGGQYFLDTLRKCAEKELCIGTTNNPSGTICVKNIGGCPIPLFPPRSNDPHFIVKDVANKPTLGAGDSACYSVEFSVSRKDVWPLGRGVGIPTTRFAGQVSIPGCGVVDVFGKADSCPQGVHLNLRQFGLNNYYYEGIIIEEGQAIKLDSATSSRVELTAGLINAASGRLDGGYYDQLKTIPVLQFAPLVKNWNITGKVCNTFPPGIFNVMQNPATVWSASLAVDVKDVVIFRKEFDKNGGGCYYYGIIWIQQIDPDGATPGRSIMDMDFCYPF